MGISSSNNARGRAGRRFRPMGEINVTPFVDVTLVLLVIFMVAAPLLTPQGVDLNLPKTDANALPSDSEPLTVSVDVNGVIYLQNTQVEMDVLIPRLTAIAENGYSERVHVRVDGGANWDVGMQILTRINVAGFSNIGLETEALEP